MRVIDYGRLLLLRRPPLGAPAFVYAHPLAPAFGLNSAFLRVLFAAIARAVTRRAG